jgi:hypothetical protein
MDVAYVNEAKKEQVKNSVEGRKTGIFAPREENFGTEYSAPPEQKIEQKRENLRSSVSPLAYPPDLTDEFYIEFNAFKHNTSRADETKRTFSFEKSVYLPFPSSVTDAYGARYSEENLFGDGQFYKDAINSLMTGENGTKRASDLLDKNLLANRGGRFLADKVNNIANDPIGTLAGAATFLSAGVGGGIGAAIKTNINVTTNPYPVLIYQGQNNMKTFAFSWTFFPESPQESTTIRKIIGYFRREMLPERMENHPSILKFPAVFEVVLQPQVKVFKRCVVTNLDVNYTPTGGPAFVKEFPVQTSNFTDPAAITMTISFQEVEIWLANDFHAEESKDFNYVSGNRTYV